MTSNKPIPPSPPAPQINPTLKAALSCLDIELEDELTRYRRHRAGQVTPSTYSRKRNPVQKPLDLTPVAPEASSKESSAPTVSISPPLATPPAPASLSLPNLDNSTPEPETPIDPLPEPPPQDYLESSEQLLRSLSDPATIQPPRRNFLDHLLTPLGVGAMLLLLCSSAILGYLITNPETADRLWGNNSKATAPSPLPTVPPVSTNPATANPNTLSGPNLANDAANNLDLNNLSSLPTQTPVPRGVVPVPTIPSGVPAAPLPSPTTASISPLNPPTQIPPTVPPVASSPSPQPTTTASPTTVPNPEGFYFVVTPYQNDRSLAQAKTAVPDAYLNGNRIYLGALKTEAQAQQLLQELRAKGIQGEIIRPN